MNTKIQKLEEVYLGIFKVVIIGLLTVALVVSAVLLIRGGLQFMAQPVAPAPAKKAVRENIDEKSPVVATDGFLESLKPKEVEPQKPLSPEVKKSEDAPKPVVNVDLMDDLITQSLEKLWVHVGAYQTACSIDFSMSRETFINSFPRRVMKGWFQRYGADFASSQDNFEKAVLGSPEAIDQCKKTNGKGGVVIKSLDWHHTQYAKLVDEANYAKQKATQIADSYDEGEIRRVAEEYRDELRRVEISKAASIFSLIISASAFGVFMSLAMLLILSKIESNLRVSDRFRLTSQDEIFV